MTIYHFYNEGEMDSLKTLSLALEHQTSEF
jgi:hypothetical protein